MLDGEEMERIKESIREYGMLTPAIAREKDGRYELISGHRRLAACKALGMELLPVILRDMTDDEAVICMVDANLQREHILPSEKAFAYKMKLEAMNRQGRRTDLTFSQVGKKLNAYEDMANDSGESRNQIHRYICLTRLIPPILQMVDDRRIAFNPAVELSYLTEGQQESLAAAMELCDCTPSHAQAIQMKKLSQDGKLTEAAINRMLSEEKPNQKEQVRLPVERIERFFPKGYTTRQKEDTIIKLLSEWQRKRERMRDEPTR